MSKIHLIIISFFFVSNLLLAQTGDILGTLQYEDKSSLVGASVLVKNSSDKIIKYAITNEKGYYNIKNIPFGTYTLEIQSMDIEKIIFSIEHRKKQTVYNKTVKQKINVLDDLQLNHETEKTKIEKKGFAVNVIETKAIALQSVQVNEVLDRSVGVRIRQSGGLGSRINYMLNGMSGNSVRIFIDGVPIRNFGPSFSLNSIPPSMIKRIEVYKGVVPAHLSDDAMGGAINIVLNTSVQNNLTASVSAGSFGTYRADVNGAYRNDKNGFTVKGSAFVNYADNNFKVWGDQVAVTLSPGTPEVNITAKRFHDRYRSQGGKVEIGFTDVKWADKILVGTLLSHMDKQVQTGATMEIVYGNRHYKQNTNMFSLDYAKKDIFDGFDASTFISYSRLDRTTIDTIATQYSWLGHPTYYYGNPDSWVSGAEAGNPTLQNDVDNTINARTNLTYRINNQNIVQFNHLLNTFKRDTDDPMLPIVQNNLREKRSFMKNIFSLSFENISVNDRLRTTLFAKSYHMDRLSEIRELEPNTTPATYTLNETQIKSDDLGYGGAISFDVTSKFTVFGSAEKAIRYPEPNEVFGNNAMNLNSSLELKPEESNNYNLGITLQNITLQKHTFGITTNVFIRDTKNLIMEFPVGNYEEFFQNSNLGKVYTEGIDFELKYNFDQKIYFSGSTSFFNAQNFDTTYDVDGNPVVLNTSNRLSNTPYFTMNYNLKYQTKNLFQKGSNFSSYANLLYVNEFYRNDNGLGGSGKTVIPTQSTIDLGLAYTFPNQKITFSLDVKNIFNEQVFDNYALQKPGRGFYGKLTYSIL